MEFAEHMLSIAEDLRFRGYVVYCPEDTETLVRESMLRSTRVRLKRERQLIKKHYDKDFLP
jgi:hypothetical protein